MDDLEEFLAPGITAKGLDPEFAVRLVRALREAKKETGHTPRIRDAYRSPERQAQYYADYTGQPVEWRGKVYRPERKGGLAAPPGKSRHQRGVAADIEAGPALDWLHKNAKDYGIGFLSGAAFKRDKGHVQMLDDYLRNALVKSLRSFGQQELDSLLDDVLDLADDQHERETTGTGRGRWSRKNRGILSNMIFGNPQSIERDLGELKESGATFRDPDFDPVSGGSRFTTFTRPDGSKGYINSRGKIFNTSNFTPMGWRSG